MEYNYMMLNRILDDDDVIHNLVKIGYTSKIGSRVCAYNTHNAGLMQYGEMMIIEGTKETEKNYHRIIKSFGNTLEVSNEWVEVDTKTYKEFKNNGFSSKLFQ